MSDVVRISNQNIEMLLSKESKKPLILKTGQNVKAIILELQSNNIAKIKIGGNIFNAQISSQGEGLIENQEMEFQVINQENGMPVLKLVSKESDMTPSKDLSQLQLGKEELNQLKSLMEKTGIRLSKSEIETIIKDDKSLKFLLKAENLQEMDKGNLNTPKTDADFQKNITHLVKDILIKSQSTDSGKSLTKSDGVQKNLSNEVKNEVKNDLKKDLIKESDLAKSTDVLSKRTDKGPSNKAISSMKTDFLKESQSFRELFKEVKSTIELVTLSNKGKVESSLSNLKAIDSVFNKNGTLEKIFNSLDENNDNKEIKEIIKEIKNFTQIEKFAKIENKNSYLEKVGSDVEKLLELLEKEEGNTKSTESRELKSVVEFVKSFNEAKEDSYYYNIPFRNNEDDYNVDMLIKRDRNGRKTGSDSFNILISLDTNSLGQVNSIIKMENLNIAIHFKVENEKIMELLEASINLLKEKLEDNVSITVGLQGEKGKFEEILQFISESSDTKFDLRI